MKTHKKGFAAFASVLVISVLLLIGSGIFTILASNVSMIKSSGEALQAQYFAQLEADMLKLVPYDELDNIDNNWQTFSNDENWQYKVKIGPEQNIDNTDAKMKIASIYVQKTGDMLERFSLQVPLSSQGSDGNKIFPDYARGYPTSTSGIIVEDGYLLVSTANYVHNWAISYIVINGGTYPLGGDAGGYAIDVIQTTLFPVKKSDSYRIYGYSSAALPSVRVYYIPLRN